VVLHGVDEEQLHPRTVGQHQTVSRRPVMVWSWGTPGSVSRPPPPVAITVASARTRLVSPVSRFSRMAPATRPSLSMTSSMAGENSRTVTSRCATFVAQRAQ